MTETHVNLSLFSIRAWGEGAISALWEDKLILLRYHAIFTNKLFPGYIPHRLGKEGPILDHAIIKYKSHIGE